MYVRGEVDGSLEFHPLAEPTDEQVAEVVQWTYERVAQVLERAGRRGLLDEQGVSTEPDAFELEQPALASCYGASVQGLDLLGRRAGQPTLRLVSEPRDGAGAPSEPVAVVGGFNVHAKTAVDGRDRKRLERLCRYVARPALAQDRLELLSDGRVCYSMKRTWSDGTRALVWEPQDFLSRLCALVPPPRFHMIRAHGVLAPGATLRPQVVPARASSVHPAQPLQLPLFDSPTLLPVPQPIDRTVEVGRRPWAWLMRHVFQVDLGSCPKCEAKMRIAEVATTVEAIDRALYRMGLAELARPPPRVKSPGQLRLPLR